MNFTKGEALRAEAFRILDTLSKDDIDEYLEERKREGGIRYAEVTTRVLKLEKQNRSA